MHSHNIVPKHGFVIIHVNSSYLHNIFDFHTMLATAKTNFKKSTDLQRTIAEFVFILAHKPEHTINTTSIHLRY